MTGSQPPAFPRWLLEHLGRSVHTSALLGDLAEQYAEGRSRTWYWIQVGYALAIQLTNALRTHLPSFVMAIVAGWMLMLSWGYASSQSFPLLSRLLLNIGEHPFALKGARLFLWLVLNWASLLSVVLLTSRLITRLHRAHQRAVLVVFVVSVMVRHFPWIVRLTEDTLTNSRFAGYLWNELFGTLRLAGLLLTSGLWSLRTVRFSEMPYRTRMAAAMVALLIVLGIAHSQLFGVSPLEPMPPLLGIGQLLSIAYLASRLWPSSPSTHSSGVRDKRLTADARPIQ